eukprot:gene5700-5939_t
MKELLADAGRRSCLKAMNRDGATPLHLAAAAGCLDAAHLLVNAGAQLDVRNRANQTPLDLVSLEDNPQLAQLLVDGRRLRSPSAATGSRPVVLGQAGTSQKQKAAATAAHQQIVGPLRSGRAAGLLPADVAAAAATTELTRVQQLESLCKEVEPNRNGQAVLSDVQDCTRQLGEQRLIIQQQVSQTRCQQQQIEHLAEQVTVIAKTVQGAVADLATLKQLQQVQPTEQLHTEQHLKAAAEHQWSTLEAQLAAQAARADDRHATLQLQLGACMDAVQSSTQRLAAVEGVTESTRDNLIRQEQFFHAALAAVSSTADAKQAVVMAAAVDAAESTAKAAVDSATDTLVSKALEAVTADISAAMAQAAEATAADAEARLVALEAQAQLQDKLSALSTSLKEADVNRDQSSLEESFIAFMDTTSSCLQQHEQQLDAMKAMFPHLEGVVIQRAQMVELVQQVASLQAAFDLIPHGANRSNTNIKERRTSGSAGSLCLHKPEAEGFETAANMMKLQHQMSALSAAVDELRQGWQCTSEELRAGQHSIRSAWKEELTRLATADADARQCLVQQQHELIRAWEGQVVQLREAALGMGAARHSPPAEPGTARGMAEQAHSLPVHRRSQISCAGLVADIADVSAALQEQLSVLQAEIQAVPQVPVANSSSHAVSAENPFLAGEDDTMMTGHGGCFHLQPQQHETSCRQLTDGEHAAVVAPISYCSVAAAAAPGVPAADGHQPHAAVIVGQPVIGADQQKPKLMRKQRSFLGNSYATNKGSKSVGGMGSATPQALFSEDLLCVDAGVLAAASADAHILHSAYGASVVVEASMPAQTCDSETEKQDSKTQKWMPWQRNKNTKGKR